MLTRSFSNIKALNVKRQKNNKKQLNQTKCGFIGLACPMLLIK